MLLSPNIAAQDATETFTIICGIATNLKTKSPAREALKEKDLLQDAILPTYFNILKIGCVCPGKTFFLYRKEAIYCIH